jgi:hypothetical protein
MSPGPRDTDRPVDATSAPAGQLPQWKLERYALGELPPDELRRVRQQLDQDPAAAARLRDLENDDRAILMQYPASRMADQIRSKAGVAAPSRRMSPWVALGPVAALAAAVALVVLPGPSPETGGELVVAPADGIIAKGDGEPSLDIVRQDDDASLTTGDLVAEGDVLGFRYHGAGAPHGVLFSVDGSGVVTLHFPPDAFASTLLGSGRVTLDLAYELDDAPGFERFFFVTGASAIDVEAVLQAAQELVDAGADRAQLELPEGLQVTDLLLRKPAPGEEEP